MIITIITIIITIIITTIILITIMIIAIITITIMTLLQGFSKWVLWNPQRGRLSHMK